MVKNNIYLIELSYMHAADGDGGIREVDQPPAVLRLAWSADDSRCRCFLAAPVYQNPVQAADWQRFFARPLAEHGAELVAEALDVAVVNIVIDRPGILLFRITATACVSGWPLSTLVQRDMEIPNICENLPGLG